jgi:S-adenosylmethionine/arginine decarboxylase-like enzyme
MHALEVFVDAYGCDVGRLASDVQITGLLERLANDLLFPDASGRRWRAARTDGGLTLVLLFAHGHAIIQTFPDQRFASVDLYSAHPVPEWPWSEQLREWLDARYVHVRALPRGELVASGDADPGAAVRKPVSEC